MPCFRAPTRQPGQLEELRGFASPLRRRFALFVDPSRVTKRLQDSPSISVIVEAMAGPIRSWEILAAALRTLGGAGSQVESPRVVKSLTNGSAGPMSYPQALII